MESPDQILFRCLSAALMPEEQDQASPVLIRRAYVNPSPPPPPEDQDAVYYHIVPETKPPLTEESLRADGRPVFHRFAPYLLHLVFYGPRAETLAWRVFHRIFLDGPGQPRRILRAKGIYPVPRPSGPRLIWEEWEKQHRPRADLTLRIRIADQEICPAAVVIESPPAVEIHARA